MMSQRMMQASLRRLAVKPTPFLAVQTRLSTTVASGEPGTRPGVAGAASPQLVEQRLRRPVVPTLTIYRPQIPWVLSSLNRITGSVMAGGFYIFGFGYLVAPLFGSHAFESATIAAAFGGLSVASKAIIKFGVALPFTFHSWNGIRHLVWDTGRSFTIKQVISGGWIVVGLTVVSSAALAAIGLS